MRVVRWNIRQSPSLEGLIVQLSYLILSIMSWTFLVWVMCQYHPTSFNLCFMQQSEQWRFGCVLSLCYVLLLLPRLHELELHLIWEILWVVCHIFCFLIDTQVEGDTEASHALPVPPKKNCMVEFLFRAHGILNNCSSGALNCGYFFYHHQWPGITCTVILVVVLPLLHGIPAPVPGL